MSFDDFNNFCGGVESIATVSALVAGGFWAYLRFIKQRDDYAFIDFTVDMNFVGKQGEWWIVELIANLENKGKVQHKFRDLSFDLEAMFQGDSLETSDKFGGQAYFPHPILRGPWVPSAEYFIEPGVRSKYSFVARVPSGISYLMLHGRFSYQKQKAWHSAEKTVKMPLDEGLIGGPTSA